MSKKECGKEAEGTVCHKPQQQCLEAIALCFLHLEMTQVKTWRLGWGRTEEQQPDLVRNGGSSSGPALTLTGLISFFCQSCVCTTRAHTLTISFVAKTCRRKTLWKLEIVFSPVWSCCSHSVRGSPHPENLVHTGPGPRA